MAASDIVPTAKNCLRPKGRPQMTFLFRPQSQSSGQHYPLIGGGHSFGFPAIKSPRRICPIDTCLNSWKTLHRQPLVISA